MLIHLLFFLLLNFPPIPYGRRLRLGCGAAEQQPAQGLCVKGEEGPEIAEAPEGGGGDDGEEYQGKGHKEAGQPEKAGCRNQKYAVETQALAEFHACDGERGQECNCAIKQDFHRGPV